MIKNGLVSVTFRQLHPAEIIDLVARAGLDAIEWGSDIHVPPCDPTHAREVRQMTADAGLRVSSYGSYYRAGEHSEVPFREYIETASILAAPTIRVWAGSRSSVDADPAYRMAVIADLCRLAHLASEESISISLEYHDKTLNDTIEAAETLFCEIREIDDAAARSIFSYWQPPIGASEEECITSLQRALPRLSYLHVGTWAGTRRQPLSEGRSTWQHYLDVVRSSQKYHYALLEFVAGNDPVQFLEDAVVLRELTAGMR